MPMELVSSTGTPRCSAHCFWMLRGFDGTSKGLARRGWGVGGAGCSRTSSVLRLPVPFSLRLRLPPPPETRVVVTEGGPGGA